MANKNKKKSLVWRWPTRQKKVGMEMANKKKNNSWYGDGQQENKVIFSLLVDCSGAILYIDESRVQTAKHNYKIMQNCRCELYEGTMQSTNLNVLKFSQ